VVVQALPASERSLAVFPCPLAKLSGYDCVVFSSRLKNEIIGKSGFNTKIRVKVKMKVMPARRMARQCHDFHGGVVLCCLLLIIFRVGLQGCLYVLGGQLVVWSIFPYGK
jgi:hypothetical protein